VKPAASSEKQWGSRADHRTAKTVGLACDLRPSRTRSAHEGPVAVATPADAKVGATSADIGSRLGSAVRKMNHDDGTGCLADLGRRDARDPQQGARQALTPRAVRDAGRQVPAEANNG
jgi:hypothetical protein